jgi:uncharacterized DUF497 family protein
MVPYKVHFADEQIEKLSSHICIDKWMYKCDNKTMSKISGFDWDEGNLLHCLKHDVSIKEIEELFRSNHLMMPDPGHSTSEKRSWAIGKTSAGRMIFIVFTIRTIKRQKFIRPISARYMHEKEVKFYEEKNPDF